MIDKGVLVGVGLLFLVNGLVIAGLRLANVMPQSYGWLIPVFLVLGGLGAFTSWVGLRHGRRWPLVILLVLYVPWTVIGLIGDTRQGYWPLVAGEVLGLLLVSWAILAIMRRPI
jgi:hypothetical protein